MIVKRDIKVFYAKLVIIRKDMFKIFQKNVLNVLNNLIL